MAKRNSKGQFIKVNGKTRYKAVSFNGKRSQEHQRAMCLLLNIDEIPKGLVVHHIDNNGKNNDINNLALMTVTAHNRLHAKNRKVWNKGLTAEDKRIKSLLEKALSSRKGSYLKNKCSVVYELRKTGMTFIDIGKELGITRETASRRFRKYADYYKLIDPVEAGKIEKWNKVRRLLYGKNMKWEDIAREMNENKDNIRRFYNSFTNKIKSNQMRKTFLDKPTPIL